MERISSIETWFLPVFLAIYNLESAILYKSLVSHSCDTEEHETPIETVHLIGEATPEILNSCFDI